MTKNKVEEIVTFVLGDILVRIIYFIGGFFVPIGGLYVLYSQMPRSVRSTGYEDMSPSFLFGLMLLCIVSAMVCAIFGPDLYKKTFHRGRGGLQDVKEASQGKQQGYRKR